VIIVGPAVQRPPVLTELATLAILAAIYSILQIDDAANRDGAFDIVITSWWRSPADNMRVGGVANSRHLTGQAVDVAIRPSADAGVFTRGVFGVFGSPLDATLAAFWRQFGASFQAVIESDHVHLELDA
jgi:D-alanyl-D-alanine dipeptidase